MKITEYITIGVGVVALGLSVSLGTYALKQGQEIDRLTEEVAEFRQEQEREDASQDRKIQYLKKGTQEQFDAVSYDLNTLFEQDRITQEWSEGVFTDLKTLFARWNRHLPEYY